jgi:hypothetical protein
VDGIKMQWEIKLNENPPKVRSSVKTIESKKVKKISTWSDEKKFEMGSVLRNHRLHSRQRCDERERQKI